MTFLLWTLAGIALIGAAIDWLPHFHNLGRVHLNLSAWSGTLLIRGKHMDVTTFLSQPITFKIAPTGVLPDGTVVPAPVLAPFWSADVGTIVAAQDGMSATFHAAQVGPAVVTVTANSNGGVALSDSANVTVAADPVVEATALNLQLAA